MRENIIKQIDNLKSKYGIGPEVFGGAIYAYKYIECNDFDSFCNYFHTVVSAAKFHHWPGGIADAIRIFCNLCSVDPGLIESYIGMRFNDIESIIKGKK